MRLRSATRSLHSTSGPFYWQREQPAFSGVRWGTDPFLKRGETPRSFGIAPTRSRELPAGSVIQPGDRESFPKAW